MRRICVAFFGLASLALVAAPALGHGTRDVGDLEWVVGWATEPAYAGQPNAVQLVLSRGGQPVVGASDDLRVEVILGEASTEALAMRTVFGSSGEYRADVIPTRPGDYTFHFTGTVDGEAVDESWTGSADGFDEVIEPSAISFPDAAPTTVQLAERVEAAEDAGGNAALPLVFSVAALLAALASLGLSLRATRA